MGKIKDRTVPDKKVVPKEGTSWWTPASTLSKGRQETGMCWGYTKQYETIPQTLLEASIDARRSQPLPPETQM